MKQFQIAYQNDEAFCEELEKIARWKAEHPSYATLFRIYSADMNPDHIRHVCDILDERMPDAQYLGCTSQANILNGALETAPISMSCTVFERETTQMRLLQFPFTEQNAKAVVRELKAYCDENPWVCAVEMHATTLGMSLRAFCDEMSALRSDVQIFGGGACNANPNELMSLVFSKGNELLTHGIVFLLLGGSDFSTYSTFIAGWKPLTRTFKVTKADRAFLYELDAKPALAIYQKFLKIGKTGNLVSNTLEFPLFMDYDGIDVLRCPIGATDGDALVMTADVEEGSHVRIAYGDPATILGSIRRDGQKIADFQPDIIQTFSCAARKAFWGDGNISDETILFNSVAPTSGFYTGGEFLRVDGNLCCFNSTLVFAAMREGEPKDGEIVNIYDARLDNIEGERIPLIRRFVSFIEATTAELEDLNRKLAISSITDGLTGLYNRTEIERRIRSTLDARAQDGASDPLSLIMLDIDDFKHINDVYGHKEGDSVIIALSNVLRDAMGDVSSSLGRWGGEEFMVLLPDSDMRKAVALAENIRQAFASISYEAAGRQTVSIGVIQAKSGEDADALYSKVDAALYAAKAGGKNQVVRID